LQAGVDLQRFGPTFQGTRRWRIEAFFKTLRSQLLSLRSEILD